MTPSADVLGTAIATAIVVGVMVVACVFVVCLAWAVAEDQYTAVARDHRRHAMRTARAMRRMTEIRQQTTARMDEAEGRRPR